MIFFAILMENGDHSVCMNCIIQSNFLIVNFLKVKNFLIVNFSKIRDFLFSKYPGFKESSFEQNLYLRKVGDQNLITHWRQNLLYLGNFTFVLVSIEF